MIQLEVCAASIESVIEAARGGASRVELCDNLKDGGTTPPLSWIEESVKQTDIQIFTLIRPRGGDFLYSDLEHLTMNKDVIHCGEAGCHGVVIGILTPEGKVDKARCSELIKIARTYNMSVTFHRAIDRTENIFEAMEDVIELGCDRILTSGGASTALEGKETLQKMIRQANGRIIILPGSGINENNMAELARDLQTNEFHGSFRTIRESKMKFIKEGVDSFESDYSTMVSSSEKIREALQNANNSILPLS